MGAGVDGHQLLSVVTGVVADRLGAQLRVVLAHPVQDRLGREQLAAREPPVPLVVGVLVAGNRVRPHRRALTDDPLVLVERRVGGADEDRGDLELQVAHRVAGVHRVPVQPVARPLQRIAEADAGCRTP